MKAVIHCGGHPEWAATLSSGAWSLLPVGNRPLLEYWLELCVALQIEEVRLVLGQGAEFVEAYAGAGEQWGLAITYSFLKDDKPAAAFLRRAPDQWRNGLLFVGAPLFPARCQAEIRLPLSTRSVLAARGARQEITCLYAGPGPELDAFCATGFLPETAGAAFAAAGLDMQPIGSVRDYYDLNMRLVRGEITRYLEPGYYAADGAYLGYNVILPPAVQCRPPLMIGNDCRLAPLCAVGPDAVLGSRIVTDRQSSLTRCIVLDGSYIGSGVEIDGKIVAGRRVVDPQNGAVADIVDPWLVATLGPTGHIRDLVRAVGGWLIALLLMLLQAIPFAVLYPLARRTGGRFAQTPVRDRHGSQMQFSQWRPPPRRRWTAYLFTMLGLDLMPRLRQVLTGRLWLCGQSPLRIPDEEPLADELPHYHPAALGYADRPGARQTPGLREVEARYYARIHSPGEDLRILFGFFWRRLMGTLTYYEE